MKDPWGEPHTKVTGVVLIINRIARGVNCRFWSHLGCLGPKVTIFAHAGIALGCA